MTCRPPNAFNWATTFRRWKPRRTRPRRRRCWSFNGATVFRRWKLVGHPQGPPVGKSASMEPPSFGGGNSQSSVSSSTVKASLQWSHRLSAVETSYLGCWASIFWPLQWSHRLSAVETCPEGYPHDWAYPLQWSHRLSAVETSPYRRGQNLGRTPSMEPPSFGGGNLVGLEQLNFVFWLLQWSHRLSAVETSH